MDASLKVYESNHLAQFLINHCGIDTAFELFKKYSLGTSRRWNGANIFWQIDYYGNIRTGKIMVYNPKTGRRIKEPCNLFSWVHSALKTPDFNLNQCFFGENILQSSSKSIAICESEKTAMIASAYLPQFDWLATGGKEGINQGKCQILNKLNRKVYFFPDLSKPPENKPTTFKIWQEKAKKYLTCPYTFSDLLENNANESDKASQFLWKKNTKDR